MNVNDDIDAWNAYPQYRWIHNKLELALKLGYDAGPACVPITRDGKYIIRPIYNLYGMGIWAEVKHLNVDKHAVDMREHKYLRPGTFWCEYFEGDHYSIDYQSWDPRYHPSYQGYKFQNFVWEPWHAIQGHRDEEENMSKFSTWKRIEVPKHVGDIPDWIPKDIKDLNIEWCGDKIIEVHLRSGNDILHDESIGTEVIPIWEGDSRNTETISRPGAVWIDNDESKRYKADSYLKQGRLGYIKLLT